MYLEKKILSQEINDLVKTQTIISILSGIDIMDNKGTQKVFYLLFYNIFFFCNYWCGI